METAREVEATRALLVAQRTGPTTAAGAVSISCDALVANSVGALALLAERPIKSWHAATASFSRESSVADAGTDKVAFDFDAGSVVVTHPTSSVVQWTSYSTVVRDKTVVTRASTSPCKTVGTAPPKRAYTEIGLGALGDTP